MSRWTRVCLRHMCRRRTRSFSNGRICLRRFWSGLEESRSVQRIVLELMRVAIMRGNLSHVQRLIAFGITISEFDDPKAPLDWAVCGLAVCSAAR